MDGKAGPPLPVLPRAGFATTHWSVVRAAGERGSPAASAALEYLCRTYWFPLYAYVRRLGCEAADAEDLTQEFFARLLAGEFIARADPAKGRFRAFLLSGIKYVLSDERDRAGRLKRGAGAHVISLDDTAAEERYRLEPADTLTPERLFEQSWVRALLETAGRRLRDEYVSAGKGDLYDALKDFRLDAAEQPSYGDVAVRLGQSESAVKSAIWRLRQRHQQLVREEIAHTVDADVDVEDEIRELLQIIGTA